MNVFLSANFFFLAALEKMPRGEMGLRYWGYLVAAVVLAAGGVFLALSLWGKRKKVLAVIALLAELAASAALVFFAEGLRQPQEIDDPGVPAIELPDMDLPAENLPESPAPPEKQP